MISCVGRRNHNCVIAVSVSPKHKQCSHGFRVAQPPIYIIKNDKSLVGSIYDISSLRLW